MAPQPKPPGQRRRRNVGQAQWQELPAGGRKGKAPKPKTDVELGDVAQEYWRTLWKSPMATAFTDADVLPLTRLVLLVNDRARHDRGEFVEEREDGLVVQYAHFNGDAEIRQLEDRFGLSPKARRALQWEIKQGDVVDMPARGQKRRLRAVEA